MKNTLEVKFHDDLTAKLRLTASEKLALHLWASIATHKQKAFQSIFLRSKRYTSKVTKATAKLALNTLIGKSITAFSMEEKATFTLSESNFSLYTEEDLQVGVGDMHVTSRGFNHNFHCSHSFTKEFCTASSAIIFYYIRSYNF